MIRWPQWDWKTWGAVAAAGVAAITVRNMRRSQRNGSAHGACGEDLGLRFIEALSPHAIGSDPLPMLIVLHSRGARPEGASTLHQALRDPARVVTPEGPIKVDGGRGWFTEHLGAKDQATLAAEIRVSGPKLAAFIRQAVRCRPTIGRPVVTGASQGGAMSLYLASQYPEMISGAVAVNGWLPEALWSTPMSPTVILSGDHDTTVDPKRTQDYAEEMQRRGAPVVFAMYDSGHSISRELGQAWRASVNEVMFA